MSDLRLEEVSEMVKGGGEVRLGSERHFRQRKQHLQRPGAWVI